MFNKKTFAFALLTILSIQSFAQTITSSPYSRFGLGELQQTNTVVSIAMGGISNGLRLENVINLSDFKEGSFGKNYGLEITDGPLAGLHSRVVLVVNENGTILYAEQVNEIADEPNYEAALAVL